MDSLTSTAFETMAASKWNKGGRVWSTAVRTEPDVTTAVKKAI